MVNLKYLQNFRGEKPKKKAKKKMRFWRSLFGFIDLLRIWNITISSIISPWCLASKQRPWERLLCFVDKTPKKWGQFWNNRTKHFVITPSKYTEYILVPASHCIRSSHKLQFHLLFAPLAFVWSFLQMEARLTMVSVDSSIDLISLVILVKRR